LVQLSWVLLLKTKAEYNHMGRVWSQCLLYSCPAFQELFGMVQLFIHLCAFGDAWDYLCFMG
jgi:hypothetical protein